MECFYWQLPCQQKLYPSIHPLHRLTTARSATPESVTPACLHVDKLAPSTTATSQKYLLQ